MRTLSRIKRRDLYIGQVPSFRVHMRVRIGMLTCKDVRYVINQLKMA